MSGSVDSPASLTPAHISWILLSIYCSTSRASTPAHGREILGLDTQIGLEDEILVVRLLIYLVRAWDATNPPPVSLDNLCYTLRRSLLTSSDRQHPSRVKQVDSFVVWLRAQWTRALDTHASHSYPTFSSWLRNVFAASSKDLIALEEDGIPDTVDRMIDRRTPLGMAMRRMYLAYDTLDNITGVRCLENRARAWCNGKCEGEVSTLVTLTSLDISLPNRMQVYDDYQRARHRGDYSATREELHRFFDYAPPSGPRGAILAQRSKLHHHALLNLAGFQIEMEEWAMANSSLKEAITLARTEKDAQCLDMCHSLKKRLEAVANAKGQASGRRPQPAGLSFPWKPTERSIQRGRLHADDLWDAVRAARDGSDVVQIFTDMQRLIRLPLPASLTKTLGPNPIAKASSTIQTGDAQRTMVAQDVARPWATAAYLCSRMGDVKAARRFRQAGREEPYRDRPPTRRSDELIMRLQESYELAEEGKYDEGLVPLLDPNMLSGMSLAEYHKWTMAIYRVLHMRARRSGDERSAERIAILACGQKHWLEREADIDCHLMPYYDSAKAFAAAGEGARSLEPILKLLQEARRCSHFVLYRRGIVLMARVLACNMGITGVAVDLLEEVMPELLADHNLERRAESSFTYAQVTLATSLAKGNLDPSTASMAVSWLLRARNDLKRIAPSSPSLLPVLNLLARLYHAVDDFPRRDNISEEFVALKSAVDTLRGHCTEGVRVIRPEQRRRDSTATNESLNPREPVVRGDGFSLSQWQELIASVGARITDSH